MPRPEVTGQKLVTKKLVVSPREAREMLDVSESFLYELLKRGELESFAAGSSRKIPVASIEAYIKRRLAAPDNHRRLRKPPVPPHKTAAATT